MPRLTQQMKEDMTKAAMKHAFTEKVKALVTDRAEWMERLYERIYPKSLRDRMYALPRGYVHEDDDIKFMVGATTNQVPFNGWAIGHSYNSKLSWAKLGNVRPNTVMKRMSESHARGGSIAIVLEATDPMAVEWEKLENRSKDLASAYSSTQQAIKVALDQCTTVKSLIKAWPEFEPFAKPYDLPDKRRLPVVQTSKLNKLLDLPIDEVNKVLEDA